MILSTVCLHLEHDHHMKERLSTYYLVAATLVVILGLAIFQFRTVKPPESTPVTNKTANTGEARAVRFLKKGQYPSFVSGVMEPGNIRLELSPEGLENGRLKVRFFANAHDQTLDPYDLALMTALSYEDRLLKPSHSDRMKGHHDSGLMFFDFGRLHDTDALSNFTITVRGLPSEKVRTFRWE
jgi:hypothetical protein